MQVSIQWNKDAFIAAVRVKPDQVAATKP